MFENRLRRLQRALKVETPSRGGCIEQLFSDAVMPETQTSQRAFGRLSRQDQRDTRIRLKAFDELRDLALGAIEARSVGLEIPHAHRLIEHQNIIAVQRVTRATLFTWIRHIERG